MSGGYELVIQGETTLLTQRMQRNQELNEHGEIQSAGLSLKV